MRTIFLKFAAICSLLPALALAEPESLPVPAPGDDMSMDSWSAPRPGPGPHRGGHGQRFSPRDRLMKLMEDINVTEAQKQQIEALLKANEEKIRSSFKTEREARRELHRIGFSDDYSDDKVKALLAKLQPAHEQVVLEKARIDNAIFKLLTPEQQKQLQERLSREEKPLGLRSGMRR